MAGSSEGGVSNPSLPFRIFSPRYPNAQSFCGPEPQRSHLPPPAAGETPPQYTHTHTLNTPSTHPMTSSAPGSNERTRSPGSNHQFRVQRSRRGQNDHLTCRGQTQFIIKERGLLCYHDGRSLWVTLKTLLPHTHTGSPHLFQDQVTPAQNILLLK